MHFITIAVIPFQKELKDELIEDINSNKNNLIDILTNKIRVDFNFYNTNTKSTPYKKYLSEADITKITEYCKIDKSERDLLLEKIRDWNGDLSSGVDEKGYYAISNHNQNGHFDCWGAYDVCLVDDALQNKDVAVHALFMPDNKFIQSEEYFFSVSEENQKNYDEWRDRVHRILKCYSPHSLLLFIDCHT